MIKTWESRTQESKSGTVDMEIDEELKTLSADIAYIISRACLIWQQLLLWKSDF